jgi:hypothetical protein
VDEMLEDWFSRSGVVDDFTLLAVELQPDLLTLASHCVNITRNAVFWTTNGHIIHVR